MKTKAMFGVGSQAKLIQKFMDEFNYQFEYQIEQGTYIYLLDLLEDLSLIDQDLVQKHFELIEKLINQQNKKITINLNIKTAKHIKHSLSKLLLSILHFDYGEKRNYPPLNNQIFNTHINNINALRDSNNTFNLLLDQLEALKVFCYQPIFSLTAI